MVTSTFNADITDGLRRGALEYLTEAGATGVTVLDVPGAFELPLLAQACAEEGHDAIVCLGAVIEGDTDHYEHVASRTSEGLMRVQLDTGVPVAFGVLTVRSVDQAIVRAAPGSGNKGREAAAAAIGAAMALRTIRSRKG
ncbi:MAG: 6,7-dimethyl-8-ribityllumazine synthase [Acidimicrobiia bacterium]|nr:6,7-dimethyl-8-ribityllumazine synthase [Acidimicrobiia bacterium]